MCLSEGGGALGEVCVLMYGAFSTSSCSKQKMLVFGAQSFPISYDLFIVLCMNSTILPEQAESSLIILIIFLSRPNINDHHPLARTKI